MRHYLFKKGDPQSEIYLASYKLWNVIWTETLQELDNIDRLHSDAYLNADYINVLTTDNDQPIACHILNTNEVSPIYQNRKAFASYPNQAWENLKKRGCTEFISYEWMCVHP
ncbi:MAG: hypothetical protein R2827_15375, partial [Bdellovibrionales bacterium]